MRGSFLAASSGSIFFFWGGGERERERERAERIGEEALTVIKQSDHRLISEYQSSSHDNSV